MAVSTAQVFPGFLTPVLTQLFFPKPLTTFLTCFCRGERREYARKKSRLNWGSNSQPPGHESDMLTTEPPGWGLSFGKELLFDKNALILVLIFLHLEASGSNTTSANAVEPIRSCVTFKLTKS